MSDCRRKTDFEYFKSNFSVKIMTLRIECSDLVRIERGFIFTHGIDDQETECGLDEYQHDFIIENDDLTSEKLKVLDLFS